MKRQLNFILLCLCFALTSHAQQQFSIPNADAIGFSRNRYEVMVYTKIGEQRYIQKRLNIDIKKTKDNDYPKKLLVNWKLISDEDTLTLNNIEAQNEVFYEVNDLQSTPLNTFMGKSFVVHDNKKWRRDADRVTYMLNFLRPDLSIVQQLFYGEKERYNHQFTLSKTVPDTLKTWRSVRSDFLLPLVLTLKNGKNVFIFYDRDVSYIMFPDAKGGLLYKVHSETTAAKLSPAPAKYAEASPYDFLYFSLNSKYVPTETAQGKYNLLNLLGQNVLKETYDSIRCDSRFIVATRGNDIDVFNLYLEKLQLGKPRMVHEIAECKVGCIEVLNQQGAAYYNEMGEQIKEPTKYPIFVCGTVAKWTYSLIKEKGEHLMKYYLFGPGTREEEDKRYLLSGCLSTDSVTFLNWSKEFTRSENSYILHQLNIHPKWIRVGRKGKFGIIAYDYVQPKYVEPKCIMPKKDDWKNPVYLYPVVKCTGKVLLPIDNDQVILKEDGLIYFYKDHKIGLFPRDTTPVYDSIERVTKSFYTIKKDGIAGWYDVKTNREFFE